MRGTTIGVIRQFFCEQCQDSRKVYINDSAMPQCCGAPMMAMIEGRPTKTACFPYTTTHLDGKGTPITVESLHHLRQLEKHYGVVVHQFSNNRNGEFGALPVQRPGGREWEPGR